MSRSRALAALLACLILPGWRADAQVPPLATIAGQVVDGRSGLGLSDARVQVQGQPRSVLTDAAGYFTLPGIPSGRYVLTVSVVGYALVRRDVEVGEGGSIHLVIPLAEGTGTYTERVEVTGDLFRQAESAVPAQQVLGSADLQNLRGLVLDDPVRAMHVLPGVAATDDLYSDFSVRGSDFGRIGLALDGVPSRFLSHTVQGVEDGGSIAMINSDILDSVSLLNGSYPQRFGNRTGAQVEMALREGSRDRSQARVALSGTAASIVGEGPIGRSRAASWLFSARKSYLDLLIKQIADNETFAFGFDDVAAKVAVDVTPRHQISVSGVAGRAHLDADQLDIGLNDPLVATNRAWLGTLAWRYAHGPRFAWTQRVGVTGAEFQQSQPREGRPRRRPLERSLGALRCRRAAASGLDRRGRRLGALAGRACNGAACRESVHAAGGPGRRGARLAVDGWLCDGAMDGARRGDCRRRGARRLVGRDRPDDGVAVGERAGPRRRRSTSSAGPGSTASFPGSTRSRACEARRDCPPSAPGRRMPASAAGSGRTCARKWWCICVTSETASGCRATSGAS